VKGLRTVLDLHLREPDRRDDGRLRARREREEPLRVARPAVEVREPARARVPVRKERARVRALDRALGELRGAVRAPLEERELAERVCGGGAARVRAEGAVERLRRALEERAAPRVCQALVPARVQRVEAEKNLGGPVIRVLGTGGEERGAFSRTRQARTTSTLRCHAARAFCFWSIAQKHRPMPTRGSGSALGASVRTCWKTASARGYCLRA
jgi:hypothetical protein